MEVKTKCGLAWVSLAKNLKPELFFSANRPDNSLNRLPLDKPKLDFYIRYFSPIEP